MLNLCDKLHYSTSLFDFFLSTSGNEASFYDARELGETRKREREREKERERERSIC